MYEFRMSLDNNPITLAVFEINIRITFGWEEIVVLSP